MRSNIRKYRCMLLCLAALLLLTACGQKQKTAQLTAQTVQADVQNYLSVFVDEATVISRFDQTQNVLSQTRIEASCVADYTGGSGSFTLLYDLENGVWTLRDLKADLNAQEPEAVEPPQEEEQPPAEPEPEPETPADPMVQTLLTGCWYQYTEYGYDCLEYQFHDDQTVSVRSRELTGSYTSEPFTMTYMVDMDGDIWIEQVEWTYRSDTDLMWSEYWDKGMGCEIPIYMEHYEAAPTAAAMEQDSEIYREVWIAYCRELVNDPIVDENYRLYEDETTGMKAYYPEHFQLVPKSSTYALRKYENVEGGQTVEFCYQDLGFSLNPKDAMQLVLDGNPTMTVHLSASGENWYAVSLESERGFYYRKAVFRKDNTVMAWFDYFTPKLEITRYNADVEYMEDHFTVIVSS